MGHPTHRDGETASAPASGDAGFTLIEVMVAMAILLFGVAGTLIVLAGSTASSAGTSNREQGTNLARDLVERSRQIAYADSTVSAAPAALRGALPASDNAVAVPGDPNAFTLTRRGTEYTVRVFACSIDDPSNGIGIGNATFCAPGSQGTNPTPPSPNTTAASVNVLGIGVNAAGSLLDTVCGAVGTNTALVSTVTGLVGGVLSAGGGAPLGVCENGNGRTIPLQYGIPDDFHRVRIDVTWTRGANGSVSQTTLLPNPS
jgi:prepilin-type N-terminal cleavage/methylation domain-containing protein